MRKNAMFLVMCILLLFSLDACTIKRDKKIPEAKINERKSAYEEYLKEKYPNETFKVEVWQEYRKRVGSGGLPNYEGYLYRDVITDKDGNRFKIWGDSKENYHDDYQRVLDGEIYYNEKGEHVHFDENGDVLFVSDY